MRLDFRLLFLFILLLLAGSCRRPDNKVHPAFYYWKTAFSLRPVEADRLGYTAGNELYVRYFDVIKADNGKGRPEAVITFDSAAIVGLIPRPVVYIVNDVLRQYTPQTVSALADNMIKLISEINSSILKTPSEIQIDCDWSDGTRDTYFALLRNIRKRLTPQTTLSCTIRLHQVKYSERTGVPPVDKGMLMFYNMGEIQDANGPNSIYNSQAADNYVKYSRKYPLPLDIALPIFSWSLHFSNDRLKEINNHCYRMDFAQSTYFSPVSTDHYRADTSIIFRGNYYLKGDIVKIEDVTPALCLEAAQKLSANLRRGERNVVFFELDSTHITKYTDADFTKILDCFK